MLAAMFILATSTLIVTVPVVFLAWVLGTAAPILTAIVTKSTASPALKSIVNALLATLGGLLAVAIKNNGHLDVYGWGFAIGNSLIASWAAYHGFLKNTVTPTVARLTSSVGVG